MKCINDRLKNGKKHRMDQIKRQHFWEEKPYFERKSSISMEENDGVISSKARIGAGERLEKGLKQGKLEN